MLKLSILIPVYNAEETIDNCLEGIKNQNLNEDTFEVLIMNDGSTDGTLLKLNQKKNYFKHFEFFSEPNCGSDISRNKLLDRASGKYIYLLDVDDYLANDSLPSILKFGLSNDLDLVAFQSKITHDIDDTAPVIHKYNLDDYPILDARGFVQKYPKFRQEIWWYLIKRKFLNQYNIRFNETQGQSNGDYIFTNECFVQASRIVFLELSVHRYFQSQDSVMRSSDPEKIERLNRNLFNAILEFDKLFKRIERDNLDLEPELLEYLKKRKGTMTNFFIHGLLKRKAGIKVVRDYIENLKEKNLYPALVDLGRDSDRLKHRIMEAVIKNELLLYLYVRFFT